MEKSLRLCIEQVRPVLDLLTHRRHSAFAHQACNGAGQIAVESLSQGHNKAKPMQALKLISH